MNVKQAVGLILTGLGTCTFALLLNFLEVFNHFQGGAEGGYLRAVTFRFQPVAFLLPNIWTWVGRFFLFKGRTHPQGKKLQKNHGPIVGQIFCVNNAPTRGSPPGGGAFFLPLPSRFRKNEKTEKFTNFCFSIGVRCAIIS